MRTRSRQIRILMSGILLSGILAVGSLLSAETVRAADTARMESNPMTVGTEVPAVFLQEGADTAVRGAEEDTTQEVLTVEARYSSNHIRFRGTEGADGYYILRADSQTGEFRRLNTEAMVPGEGQESYSYVDETAGTNTRYW